MGSIMSLTTTLATATTLVALVSACAFSKDADKRIEDPKIAQLQQQLDANQPVLATDLKHEFIPLREPKKYMAKVSWTAGRPISVTISLPDGFMQTFDGRTQSYFEMPCKDEQIAYKLESFGADGRGLSSFFIHKQCPVDGVIGETDSSTAALAGITGRLILKNGASIVVRKDLDINVSSLEIQGTATIRTFDSSRSPILRRETDEKAPQIRIKAQRASGYLNLELNGFDGSKGLDAANKSDASLNGRPGNPGILAPSDPRMMIATCSTEPTDGGPGADAPQTEGVIGSRGGAALGTSNARIDIQNVELFNLEIKFNPGTGGPGGKGAVYKGGDGGEPGHRPAPACNIFVKRGPRGKDSPVGPPGPQGENGSCGTIEIPSALALKTRFTDLNLECSKSPLIVQRY